MSDELSHASAAYGIASGLVLTKKAQDGCLRNSDALEIIIMNLGDLLLEVEAIHDRCGDNLPQGVCDCKNCPMVEKIIPFHEKWVAPASKRARKNTKHDFHAGYSKACHDMLKSMKKNGVVGIMK